MLKVAYIAMWGNGVVLGIKDIPATGIVATGIVAMDIVATTAIPIIGGMGGIPGGTTAPTTTGLITGAIMATHMEATTTGLMGDSGLATVIKAEEERGSWRRQQCVAINSELQY